MSDPTQDLRVCPVTAAEHPDWSADYTGVTTDQLVALTDAQLAEVDPLVVNLVVAREITRLADLEIGRYQEQLNSWTTDFATRYLPFWEEIYAQQPEFYGHRHHLFQVGMIAQYLDHEIGVSYKSEQLGAVRIRFLNPSDLFLNGLLDTLEGTCGNMAALHVAIAWRMGWAVSLACAHTHYLVRHDDGTHVFNIEATCTGQPGFVWGTDEEMIAKNNLPPIALSSGSDMRALAPRERLGVFVNLRARHYQDVFFQTDDRQFLHLAEQSYSLAKYLFPAYRQMNLQLTMIAALTAAELFERDEAGHPATYGQLYHEVQAVERGTHRCQEPMPPPREPGGSVCIRPADEPCRPTRDEVFAAIGSN